VDLASSIISYKTLYNLHCAIIPKADEETLYPAGVVSKALKNVAFQDEGLIQYKAEVMLRIFEERIKPLINGHAKAMIVTSSRLAGLRYFEIIKDKLKEREGADYKVLYAFSDFIHPETNQSITEIQVNGLRPGEFIEDRFAAFAEYVSPQLIKQGSVSELMKQMRQTSVVKASVQYKGGVAISGKIKLKKGRKGGGGPPPKKVSVQDIETTQRLQQAGEIMGITVLDHIIFNGTDYFSFLKSGIGL